MRIGIDFHVVDGIFQGSRTHILELFSRVIAISPEINFFLFLEKGDILRNFSPAFSLPNSHIIYMPHTNPIKRLCWQLPKMQKKYKLDYLHTQYILPMPNFSPCVVTIHDVLFESHPQYFKKIFRLRSKLLIRWATRKSVHIFTVSEYSRMEIMNRYHVSPEKLTVIHNGIDLKRFYPGDKDTEIVKNRGLLPNEYILTVGRIEPRKNHLTMLKAYSQLGKKNFPLVIIGQRDYGYKSIYELIESLGLRNRILFIENISDKELPAFYRHARIFIYPSWAEGFGMPVVEAMASGTPVIASNTTSLPEIVGDAGCLTSPISATKLKNSIEKILSDKQLYTKMQKEGLAQASAFKWSDSALRVRNYYLRSNDVQVNPKLYF